jgi:hypothetical protein
MKGNGQGHHYLEEASNDTGREIQHQHPSPSKASFAKAAKKEDAHQVENQMPEPAVEKLECDELPEVPPAQTRDAQRAIVFHGPAKIDVIDLLKREGDSDRNHQNRVHGKPEWRALIFAHVESI